MYVLNDYEVPKIAFLGFTCPLTHKYFVLSFWFIAYPHVGCFTAASIRRCFNRKLPLSGSKKGEDDVMRCFKAARAENYRIFAIRKPRKKGVLCWTDRDAEENLKNIKKDLVVKMDLAVRKYSTSTSCQVGQSRESTFLNQIYKYVLHKRV